MACGPTSTSLGVRLRDRKLARMVETLQGALIAGHVEQSRLAWTTICWRNATVVRNGKRIVPV